MRQIVGWLGAALMAAAFVVGFIAYFVTTVDPRTGAVTDGLGRPLSPAPLIVQLTQVQHWPGLTWWLFDMVVFWATFLAGVYLAAYGFREKRD